jgi:hypothetical protein
MSIELHEEAGGKVLVVKMSGTLGKADYGRFVLKAEQLIKKQGKLRILCEVHNFDGRETGAEQEDERDYRIYEFERQHFADVERLAFVGEEALEQTWAAFFKPFVAAEVRYF